MEIKVNKDKNNTYKIDVTVDKSRVNEVYEEALKHEAENVEVKGFRKGKAPLNKVKENVDQAHLRSHALNHLVEEVQKKVLTENKFAPIVYPRYEIQEFEEGTDLKLTMIIIEKPEIEIGDYKKAVKEKKSEKEKASKEAEKNNKNKENPQPVSSDINNEDVTDALLSVSKIEVAEQLINEEADRMLSSMMNQLKQMGVDLKQYLDSIKKTAEEVRDEYKKLAERNIKADFILTEIAQKEGLEATDEDVQKTIDGIPDEASKQELSKPEQKMYIKAVLLKNKTLMRLSEIANGDKKADNNDKDSKKESESKSSSKKEEKK